MCLKTCRQIYAMHISDKKNMDGENVIVKAQKRKKVRRLKKRKFCSLFDIERTNESGVPVKQRKTKTAAPENTTQFIMADKELTEPFYVIHSPTSSPASHCTSSPGSIQGTPFSERDLAFDSTEEDLVREFEELDFDLDFFQRDYEATYNRIQEESLLALSKSELVSKYRELEGKEDILQKRCQELRKDFIHGEHEDSSRSENSFLRKQKSTKEENLLRQLEALQKENRSLAEENLRLKDLKSSTVEIISRLS